MHDVCTGQIKENPATTTEKEVELDVFPNSGRSQNVGAQRTAPIGDRLRGAAHRNGVAPDTLAFGLISTYRREMHLSFGPSRQVVEVASIFSALRGAP